MSCNIGSSVGLSDLCLIELKMSNARRGAIAMEYGLDQCSKHGKVLLNEIPVGMYNSLKTFVGRWGLLRLCYIKFVIF